MGSDPTSPGALPKEPHRPDNPVHRIDWVTPVGKKLHIEAYASSAADPVYNFTIYASEKHRAPVALTPATHQAFFDSAEGKQFAQSVEADVERMRTYNSAHDRYQQALNATHEQQQAGLLEGIRDAEPVYIRYGKLPNRGVSANGRDKRLEPGVSVYAGFRTRDGRIILDLRKVDPYSWFTGVKHNTPYLVSGEPLAVTGADNEPLLKNAVLGRPIKDVSVLFKPDSKNTKNAQK